MPPDLDVLRKHYAEQDYLLSTHASEKAAERAIRSHEIEEAISSGEVIEDYPDDKYGPSCLIMGKTVAGRVLHIQTSYPPNVKVITLYEPSSDKWESDFKTRKSHE